MGRKLAAPVRPVLRRLIAVAVAASCAIVPLAAAPQKPVSLAELAKQELERRKAVTVPARVFTAKDIKTPPKPPVPEQGAADAAPASVKQAATAAAPDKPVKDEAWWRARVIQVSEDIRRNEIFAESLQTRINALAADFANRDDPFERLKIGDDRQKALNELERVRSEILLAKKRLADIEEEARQAGVPPGWLR